MNRRAHELSISGSAELRSATFSPVWQLFDAQGNRLCELRRHPRMHITTVRFADGAAWVLRPDGWGIVRAVDTHDRELGRITRRSWWGRRWDISSPQWAYALVSDPFPRRWHLVIGGVPIAAITGSALSYNRVHIEAPLSVPATAILLAWHVIARPWEAAAAPRGLVPAPVAEGRTTLRPAEGAT